MDVDQINIGTRAEPVFVRRVASAAPPPVEPRILSFEDIRKHRDEAIEKLVDLQECSDIERAHCEADDILADFLTVLGHGDIVDLYNGVDKWYA